MTNRVLICGGRQWTDRNRTFEALDEYHQQTPIDTVIHGAARGADTLADQWAHSRNVPVEAFPVSSADWRRFGKVAGHLRNQRMLKEGAPNEVVAFPGGAGTADMIHRARAAKLPVKQLR